ncbi:hypothetical protein K6Y74_03370 [Burkholderia cenocepacia]|jgi:hypothetical protein|uniref:hypothetical protein n=1 Tax=Burkholderia cenocepacia TaxID=95486 RepID=UPI00078BF573|nr:hypothetical protein [Burkholderia cenocepacia]AMU12163.1 hypothetical protein A3203_03055 [Burkholderia cenocepacia]MCW3582518.1 hypothetical protein [Burkholderia cenocepacia]MCW3626605.1 hypothetical protein [Burkholderia cenocepacia]MCW3642261.1 hypothetical protein [Burkholderia cenocepacia]MCW5179580.1 hypothetical protein [Burkholderia cenocepacia]
MSTDALTIPNDVCRAGCDLALRMVAQNGDWQHEWHALAGRRIERDRIAVRRLQQALAETREWTAFAEASRQVMTDYTVASVAIWQDATELCMRAQFESAGAWRTWLREYGAGALSRYQTDWLPDLGRLAVVNEASMPWADWMAALERGIEDVAGAKNGVAAGRLNGIAGARESDHVR